MKRIILILLMLLMITNTAYASTTITIEEFKEALNQAFIDYLENRGSGYITLPELIELLEFYDQIPDDQNYVTISGAVEDIYNQIIENMECTDDVYVCDDGTELSRVPPTCKFPECPENHFCDDSDGGENIEEKGTCTDNWYDGEDWSDEWDHSIREDHCTEEVLIEWYCSPGPNTECRPKEIVCQGICIEGTCQDSPPPPPEGCSIETYMDCPDRESCNAVFDDEENHWYIDYKGKESCYESLEELSSTILGEPGFTTECPVEEINLNYCAGAGDGQGCPLELDFCPRLSCYPPDHSFEDGGIVYTCENSNWVEGSMETNCDDGEDDDGDGLVDCADNDCEGGECGTSCEYVMDWYWQGWWCDCNSNEQYKNCDYNIENGCEVNIKTSSENCERCGYECAVGSNSCTDGECHGSVEQCDDGIDNDGDNLIDCAQQACDEKAAKTGNYPKYCEYGTELNCNDHFDNDADGLFDCQDEDCDGMPATNGKCEHPAEETCNDGEDNDDDGLYECQDPDCCSTDACSEHPACAEPRCYGVQHCTNGGSTFFAYCGDCQGMGCSPGFDCTRHGEDYVCKTYPEEVFYFDEAYPVDCSLLGDDDDDIIDGSEGCREIFGEGFCGDEDDFERECDSEGVIFENSACEPQIPGGTGTGQGNCMKCGDVDLCVPLGQWSEQEPNCCGDLVPKPDIENANGLSSGLGFYCCGPDQCGSQECADPGDTIEFRDEPYICTNGEWQHNGDCIERADETNDPEAICCGDLELKLDLYWNVMDKDYVCCRPDECAADWVCFPEDSELDTNRCINGEWIGNECNDHEDCPETEVCINNDCESVAGYECEIGGEYACHNYPGTVCKEDGDYDGATCCPETMCALSDGCVLDGAEITDKICEDGKWRISGSIDDCSVFGETYTCQTREGYEEFCDLDSDGTADGDWFEDTTCDVDEDNEGSCASCYHEAEDCSDDYGDDFICASEEDWFDLCEPAGGEVIHDGICEISEDDWGFCMTCPGYA